jgi:hypothetical protein
MQAIIRAKGWNTKYWKTMVYLDQKFYCITFLGPKTDLFLIVHLPCFIQYDLVCEQMFRLIPREQQQ